MVSASLLRKKQLARSNTYNHTAALFDIHHTNGPRVNGFCLLACLCVVSVSQKGDDDARVASNAHHHHHRSPKQCDLRPQCPNAPRQRGFGCVNTTTTLLKCTLPQKKTTTLSTYTQPQHKKHKHFERKGGCWVGWAEVVVYGHPFIARDETTVEAGQGLLLRAVKRNSTTTPPSLTHIHIEKGWTCSGGGGAGGFVWLLDRGQCVVHASPHNSTPTINGSGRRRSKSARERVRACVRGSK